NGIDTGEFIYKADSWKERRRIILIRQSTIKRPRAFGKMLFKELPEYCSYKYQLYITNMDITGAEVWRLYRQRADSENRIKELKSEFGMNGFCLHKFYGTEAAFRMVLVAYNLLSLFRQGILKQQVQQTLSTIRFKCFALGGWIAKTGRKKVLKLAVAMQRRVWLDGLFSRLVDFSAPFPIKT
ncbi:MAG: transposase, partial [Candidatus Omnitrophota bacterium]|nr:transposase [Candidatus Omnitrophota bacterium]